MLLVGKNAIVYGAAGLIGAATARTFAGEGARFFLAGRTLATLDEVARQIRAAGGVAHTAALDVLDEQAVERHAEAVAQAAGSIDVAFNAVGIRGDLQGTPLLDVSLRDFATPISVGVTAHFLTARAVGRRMLAQRSGVLVLLSATATWNQAALRTPIPMGGFGVACAAVEALARTLAGELGPCGVRVVCLRSEGTAELLDRVPDEGFATGGAARLRSLLEGETLLRRLPTVAEVASTAALLASDQASALTATIVNVNSVPD